ncbi:disA bacterial checkpoint controller nucleotide-binding domain-containing protein [Ditylenchus destructor]|uniref:DisA bacterial checkpoint controller nucleotide-binding domain-containing protein n=1 Tax=Ditylenchus destructor TaxID=166010 RepID=A0AAD4MKP3_9BILA|nr:disA bacterial checkpoint controller nucleotide-binding domain-containing protein [Ditylenchus destructor]
MLKSANHPILLFLTEIFRARYVLSFAYTFSEYLLCVHRTWNVLLVIKMFEYLLTNLLFFLDEIIDTIHKMARKRIGATIIFSYDSPVELDFMLKEISKYSRKLDKPFTPPALMEVFRNERSPLHDGALIIAVLEQRMHSASNKISTDPVDYDLFPDTKVVGGLCLRHCFSQDGVASGIKPVVIS